MIINTEGVAAGNYTLVLESYNILSSVRSALKKDTIEITVVEPPPIVPPSFMTELKGQVVTAGTESSWYLPEIDEGSLALLEVVVEPGESVAPYITYEDSARKIVFADDESSESLVGSFLTIVIKLLNVNNDETSYLMGLQVLAAEQELLIPEEEPAAEEEESTCAK